MPVPTSLIVKCAVCGVAKNSTNRWFLFGAYKDSSAWSFDRYKEEWLHQYDGAACGIECLLKEAQKHALALMAAHPAGRR